MLIPYQDLDSDTLHNLIESFILREGTDYGEREVSLSQKTEELLQQLKLGSIVIIYSELSETVSLVHKSQLNEQMQLTTEQ